MVYAISYYYLLATLASLLQSKIKEATSKIDSIYSKRETVNFVLRQTILFRILWVQAVREPISFKSSCKDSKM